MCRILFGGRMAQNYYLIYLPSKKWEEVASIASSDCKNGRYIIKYTRDMQVKAAHRSSFCTRPLGSCRVQDAPDPASVGPMTLAGARQSCPSPCCKGGLYQDLWQRHHLMLGFVHSTRRKYRSCMYLTIFTLCVGESRANSHCQSAATFARAASLKTVWCPKKSCEVMQLVRSMRHPAQLGIMMLVDVSCIMSFQQ